MIQRSNVSEVKSPVQRTLSAIDGQEPVLEYPAFINIPFDYVPRLLATVMVYADIIGLEILELENWEDLLKFYDLDSKKINVPTYEKCDYEYFISDYTECVLAQLPDRINNVGCGKNFFGMRGAYSNKEYSYLPVINSEGGLEIFATYGTGQFIEFTLNNFIKKYYSVLSFSKEDASELFKGVVTFLMTEHSGIPRESIAYMFWQYDRIKEGLSEGEIDNLAFNLL